MVSPQPHSKVLLRTYNCCWRYGTAVAPNCCLSCSSRRAVFARLHMRQRAGQAFLPTADPGARWVDTVLSFSILPSTSRSKVPPSRSRTRQLHHTHLRTRLERPSAKDAINRRNILVLEVPCIQKKKYPSPLPLAALGPCSHDSRRRSFTLSLLVSERPYTH